MDFKIQYDKNKNFDWLKEYTLTKEQLIAQKLERNKNQSEASTLLA